MYRKYKLYEYHWKFEKLDYTPEFSIMCSLTGKAICNHLSCHDRLHRFLLPDEQSILWQAHARVRRMEERIEEEKNEAMDQGDWKG